MEHVNAEIVLGTITSMDDALEWIKCSYLFIRLSKNPAYYNIPNTANIEEECLKMCKDKVSQLLEKQIITLEGGQFKPTEVSKSMARYYV